MKNFSISDSLSQGWDLLKRNILLVVLAFITCLPGVFSEVLGKTSSIPENPTLSDLSNLWPGTLAPLFGGAIVLTIIGMILEAGFNKATLNVVYGGKADFNCFNLPAATYVKYVCVQICYNILVAIGLCFCIIPGILFHVRFSFAPMIIIDDPECGFTDAFQRSWDMTRGNFLNLFVFYIISIVILIIGLVCCCIGIFVAYPLINLAYAIIYLELKPEDNIVVEEVAMK